MTASCYARYIYIFIFLSTIQIYAGMDRNCLKEFPAPPPLPPFSLCDRKQQTTQKNTPISTIPTTRVPPSRATTKPTTEMYTSHMTSKPTTEMYPTQLTTKATTDNPTSHITTKSTTRSTSCKTTRKPITTRPPYRTSTHWWEWFTFRPPMVRTTTTMPPWSTTKWTTTPNPAQKDRFMRMWWSCASVYYTHRDIYSCTVNCYFRPCNGRGNSKCYNSCVPFRNNRRHYGRRIVAPTTAASVFNAVPTQLFPTSRYTSSPNNWFGQSDFLPIDLYYISMLSEL
ncbi:uncharacterized protein LOC132720473 isoform X2 [Ruditapes philippinarum]|uniref:uncharacterized protein LOC132720473 isoform X2 n=1 Tax=Ruditapes philippinarum TaxID=129788 RepID=UPI00295BD69B|nr:uncharacterized protein LOC132720473 isoform X2 [Ruditapes philippinarum]